MNALSAAAAAAALFLCASTTFAGSREDALNAVARCAVLKEDHARLACYDATAAQVKDALAAPIAPQATATTEEQQKSWFGLPEIFGGGGHPAQTTPQQFGNEYLPPPPPPAPVPGQPVRPAPEVIDSIAAGVSDYAFNPFGRFTVFLDNGQIWQQLQGDTDQARFKKSSPNTVTISRGMLGSYNLKVNDSVGIFKVKRLK
jgi:hypothetical protein